MSNRVEKPRSEFVRPANEEEAQALAERLNPPTRFVNPRYEGSRNVSEVEANDFKEYLLSLAQLDTESETAIENLHRLFENNYWFNVRIIEGPKAYNLVIS